MEEFAVWLKANWETLTGSAGSGGVIAWLTGKSIKDKRLKDLEKRCLEIEKSMAELKDQNAKLKTEITRNNEKDAFRDEQLLEAKAITEKGFDKIDKAFDEMKDAYKTIEQRLYEIAKAS